MSPYWCRTIYSFSNQSLLNLMLIQIVFVAVIEGNNCSNLPTFTESNSDCQKDIKQNTNTYALNSSSINVTTIETDRPTPHHVWITGTEDARKQLSSSLGDFQCSNYSPNPKSDSDMYCFPLTNHTSEHFLVSKPGFYHARTDLRLSISAGRVNSKTTISPRLRKWPRISSGHNGTTIL